MKKIELNLLFFVLIEAFFLLFFFKQSLLNIIVGTVVGIILIILTKKMPQKRTVLFSNIFLSFFLIIKIFQEITSFITYNLFNHYPIIIIAISFLMISFYLAYKGYHTYIKSLEISFYFFLFIKFTKFLLLVPNISINHYNYQLVNQLSFNFDFLYISLSILYLNFLIRYFTNYQIKLKVMLLAVLNPFLMKIISIGIMGTTLFNLYQYPYFNVLKRIKYLEFIERMEGILSFEYLFAFLYLTSFILLFLKSIVKSKNTKSFN